MAQSKRGRELRAAAALARFETNKSTESTESRDLQKSEDSDQDDEYEDVVDAGQEDALDLNGERLVDGRGQGMVRVCDEEDTDDTNVKHEMTELENLDRYFKPIQQPTGLGQNGLGGRRSHPEEVEPHDGVEDDDPHSGNMRRENAEAETCAAKVDTQGHQDPLLPALHDPVPDYAPAAGFETTRKTKALNGRIPPPDKVPPPSRSLFRKHTDIAPSGSISSASPQQGTTKRPPIDNPIHPAPADAGIRASTGTSLSAAISAPTSTLHGKGASDQPKSLLPLIHATDTTTISCPICSLENPRLNATCLACSHVIDPYKDPRHWSCQSDACREGSTGYLNAGDTGICGICGVRKSSSE